MAETSDMRFLNVYRRHLDIFWTDAKRDYSNLIPVITNLEIKLDLRYLIG